MKPNKISDQLLEKYLSNRCTPEEKRLVEEWYNELGSNADILSTLEEDYQQQIKEQVFDTVSQHIQADKSTISLRPLHQWWWIAAACLLLATPLGFFLATNQSQSWLPIALEKQTKSPIAIQFTNEKNTIVRYTLPDESTIWMHPKSSISYPETFSDTSRQVTFTGEGFFDVKKDSKRAFLITTGEMTIRVLGTSFNVKTSIKDNHTQVSVLTGSVQVSTPTPSAKAQTIVLAPQQHALFEHQSKVLLVKNNSAEVKREIFEPVSVNFDDKPLSHVLEVLERRFDTKLQLANPKMATCLFNGDFEHQSLVSILEILCLSLEATYSISDNTITIEGTACN